MPETRRSVHAIAARARPILLGVAAGLFVAACGPSDSGGAPAAVSVADEAAEAPIEPAELGPVHEVVLADLEGGNVSLAKFAGRPMIIEVWATWCGPCRRNRQLIHELKKDFPERLVVIGVSVDSKASLVTNFLRSNPANELELMATPAFMQLLATRSISNAIPKTVYVNGRGQIVDVLEGVQSANSVRAMAKNLR